MSDSDLMLDEIIPGLRGPGTHVASEAHQKSAVIGEPLPAPKKLGKAQAAELAILSRARGHVRLRPSVGDALCRYGYATATRMQAESWGANGSVSISWHNRYQITDAGRERLRVGAARAAEEVCDGDE